MQSSAVASLAHVARGLSAIFWSLPLVLLADSFAAMGGLTGRWSPWTGFVSTGLLLHGLRQLRRFHPQERVWTAAVDRAWLLGWLVWTLSPSPGWWRATPREPFFAMSLALLMFAGLATLAALNQVVARLALMLPDAVLRSETRLLTRLNIGLFLIQALVLGAYLCLLRQATLPPILDAVFQWLDGAKAGIVLFLALAPVALTMALTWKAKEVILNSAFASLADLRPR